MVSHLHENLVEMFRQKPEFAAHLLSDQLGIPVPPFEKADVSSGELNVVLPTEFRADLVVSMTKDDKVVLAVIIEAQLRAADEKRLSWPAYVATLYARLGCPVALLVMCPSRAVAAWCSTPIRFGLPNVVLTPLVMGPQQVPPITDPDAARRNPELTVLSALAHANKSPDQDLIFKALLAALTVIEPDHAERYHDLVMETLSTEARDYMEELMTTAPYRFQSDFARRYFDKGELQGKAEGKAEAVLAVLNARGITPTDREREHILSSTDSDQLAIWLSRVATVTTTDELFS